MHKFPFLVTLLAFCGTARSADFAPSLEWVKTAGGSGLSTATAAAADASGNLYIAGNTSSVDFPAVSAAQPNPGGSPLVRINPGTRAAQKLYPQGLSVIGSIAADPQNSNTLYATSANTLWRSPDAGSTWTLLYSFASSIRVVSAAVDPSNSNILYAGTDNQGVFKSIDGGLTWTAINSGIPSDSNGDTDVYRIWIEPQQPRVILAASTSGIVRSADGGATWTVVLTTDVINNTLAFDPLNPGTVYVSEPTGPIVKSTDGGLTFTALPSLPGGGPATALIVDPLHAGVLYASLPSSIFQSLDGGVTWTAKAAGYAFLLAADPNHPVLYADILNVGIVKSTDGFNSVSPVGPPNASLMQMLVAGENLLLVAAPSDDVFVLKLDPNGNIVYSTYFGGSGNDMTGALAVGADGSVYVAGVTESPDFPVTGGACESSAPSPFTTSTFILKLNPDGSVGWATYFADFRTQIHAIALDSAGNPYLSGLSAGGLPTTPGAYQTQFQQSEACTGFIGCIPGPTSAFVTKFNALGTGLIYSTYVSADRNKNVVQDGTALAVDASGDVFFGGQSTVIKLNSTGSELLASAGQRGTSISALALDANSNVYTTGIATYSYNGGTPSFDFPSTPMAFQPLPQPAIPNLPGESPAGGGSDAFVVKWDSNLSQILAATLLGGEQADAGESIAIDGSGDVIVSGVTDSKAFPTQAPSQTSFSDHSGFVAGLDSSLSHLLFSTYLGDTRAFDAHVAVFDGQGNILIAGSTLNAGGLFIGGDPGQSYNIGDLVVANKITLPEAPAVRLDSVQNFASRIAAPIAPGETIVAMGSGFGPDAQIYLDGVALTSVSAGANSIVAVMPDDAKISGAFAARVSSGGNMSNPVLVPAAPASPGIYSLDGSGFGQGYILNSDGSMNSPSNPAAPGSAITIFATGAGQYSLSGPYSVTAQTPAVFVDGFYANGIASVIGPVAGLPGNVYQIGVYVPDPAKLVDQNPNLANFQFPPQLGVKLVMSTVNPYNPDNSEEISQPGLVLNVK